MARDGWATTVPPHRAVPVHILYLNPCLLPGLAFDRSLSRLGYGKGYYDRFLASYAAQLQNERLRPRLGKFQHLRILRCGMGYC